MTIQTDLQDFYNANAEQYYHTRSKHRADAPLFLEKLIASGKKSLKILEFGCGSGRLLAHLASLRWVTITYIWVDLSEKLLSFAKKNIRWSTHIKATFVCDDIVHYLPSLSQESFDVVIGVASFQHISTRKQRFLVLKHIYRILRYDGLLMMTNWSFSDRFLRKYRTECIRAIWRYCISFGKYQWNDIMVPRDNQHTRANRFYHIYTLRELSRLVVQSGFVIDTLSYLKKWSLVSDRRSSQNSIVITHKRIFLQNLPN